MIAKVIVDVNVKNVNKPFDYSIPKRFLDYLEVGMRVIVPFGMRKVMGFVVMIDDEETKGLKETFDCLDVVPVLNREMLDLGIKLANETASNYIQTFKTMLPSALNANVRKFVYREGLPVPLLVDIVGDKVYLDNLEMSDLVKIKKAIKEFDLEIQYEVKEQKPLIRRFVKVTDELVEFKNEKQEECYNYIKENGEVLKSDVTSLFGSCVNTLIKYGSVIEEDSEVYREVEYDIDKKEVILTKNQKEVSEAVKGEDVYLLHGITSSGKTEVYLDIISRVINSGKEAILLVPEISLTYQMISRFKGRLGDDVAILHSGLSMGERYDEWRKILRKEAKCVIGARSAIFAPLTNIGVIILDEEHESTYKQEEMPRYHAREVAKERASYHKCPVVLGSATPAIESYARAKRGVYKLLELKERVLNANIPEVSIVEMSAGVIFSNDLLERISDRLKKKEQVILLLNRRGYSNFAICTTCGELVKCPHCDISLTYHQNNNMLMCHYCGFKEPKLSKCPSCESLSLDYQGVGTEKAYEELGEIFPDARVLRMDQDTTRRKLAHQRILRDFQFQKADILIGTQMIAKGLDFPNVTLVGVLSCDTILGLPDFRASEKTYQLLTQVAGRAGRRERMGEVILQTYNPNHYAITGVLKTYEEFYDMEMKVRKLAGYIPYYFMETIMISALDYNILNREAQNIKRLLQKNLPDAKILGPTVPGIARIKNRYRMQIIIKYRKTNNLLDTYKEIIKYQHKEILLSIDRYPNFIG